LKFLVDTCVWSLLLRRRNGTDLSGDDQLLLASLREAIQDGRVAMIGPIRQEILSGIKDSAQFEKLRSTLNAFPDEPITTPHYEEAARLFNRCRSRGVQCGSVDMLLCSVAVKERWSILTRDEGLKRCIEVLRNEGFFQSFSTQE
jgi:predicted nucleic acid-binding protein